MTLITVMHYENQEYLTKCCWLSLPIWGYWMMLLLDIILGVLCMWWLNWEGTFIWGSSVPVDAIHPLPLYITIPSATPSILLQLVYSSAAVASQRMYNLKVSCSLFVRWNPWFLQYHQLCALMTDDMKNWDWAEASAKTHSEYLLLFSNCRSTSYF